MRGVAVPSKNQMRVIGTIESSKHWQGDREEAKAQVLLLGVWPLWKVAQIESLTDELTKTETKLLSLKEKVSFSATRSYLLLFEYRCENRRVNFWTLEELTMIAIVLIQQKHDIQRIQRVPCYVFVFPKYYDPSFLHKCYEVAKIQSVHSAP